MGKLYNNIIFDNKSGISDPQDVPYLKEPPEVIDVTVGRQLFADDFLIAETELKPEYHKAKKYEGNPVFYAETDWEKETLPCACPKSGGVWYDEQDKIFKMWYEGSWLKNMCYAESKDGINWERPKLNGDGTNIILPYDNFDDEKLEFHDIKYLRPDSTTVFIDYDCPKEEKYELFLRGPGGCFPGIVAVSADGINFKRFAKTGDVFDRTTIFYNPFRKKWVYSIRKLSTHSTNGYYRTRDYAECDDLIKGAAWKEKDVHNWLRCDELDLPMPYIRETPEIYNADCVGYESIMLGMFQILYGPSNEVCEEYGVPKITELIPMYSRDGYNFSRPCRESIINASMYKGAWDRGYVQSVGGTLIIHGDELWIYYIGFGGDENLKLEKAWTRNGMYANGATGLAKLRRDGFVSMNGDGMLTTRKLTFKNKADLYVNIDGKISAEILSDDGTVLAKSDTFSGNSTKARLNFDGLDIKSLNGKVIRLKFNVSGKLYSFGFADINGDFGGAHAAGCYEV